MFAGTKTPSSTEDWALRSEHLQSGSHAEFALDRLHVGISRLLTKIHTSTSALALHYCCRQKAACPLHLMRSVLSCIYSEQKRLYPRCLSIWHKMITNANTIRKPAFDHLPFSSHDRSPTYHHRTNTISSAFQNHRVSKYHASKSAASYQDDPPETTSPFTPVEAALVHDGPNATDLLAAADQTAMHTVAAGDQDTAAASFHHPHDR
jgi:hypothetical protein